MAEAQGIKEDRRGRLSQLAIEFVVLFVLLPALFALRPFPIPALPILWLVTAYCYWVRRRQPQFGAADLWNRQALAASWRPIVALFLPAADYNRSYRVFAERLAQHVPAGECVTAVGVSNSMRAVLAFYSHVRFASDAEYDACALALRPHYRKTPPEPLPAHAGGDWNLVWEGRRPVRSDENWQLWRR